jgi:hypothetical protein
MRVHDSPCSDSDTIGIIRTRAYCGSSPSALASAWTAWTLSSVKHPIRQSGSSRVSDGANRQLNCPDRGTIGGSGANRDYRMSTYDKALRPHSALRLRLQSAKLRARFGPDDAGASPNRDIMLFEVNDGSMIKVVDDAVWLSIFPCAFNCEIGTSSSPSD